LKHPDDARTFRYMIVSAQVDFLVFMCSASLFIGVRQPVDAFDAFFQYRNSLSFTEETWTAAQRSLWRIDRLVLALQKIVDGTCHDSARSASIALPVSGASIEDTLTPPDEIAVEEDVEDDSKPSPYDSDFIALCEQCLVGFEAAMCDDLNAPRATAALFVLVGAAERAIRRGDCTMPHAAAALQIFNNMNEVLGVLYDVPKDYFPEVQSQSVESMVPAEVVALAELRKELKTQKDFAEADVARSRIAELGYKIVDGADSFVLTKL